MSTEAAETTGATGDEEPEEGPVTRTGPRRRWVPIAVLIVVAMASAALTWLLITIFEHKQEAKSPFAQVVQLTDTTYDPAVWGENFPIEYEQYKKTAEDTDGDFVKVDPTADDRASTTRSPASTPRPGPRRCGAATPSPWTTPSPAVTSGRSRTSGTPSAPPRASSSPAPV